MQRGNGGVEGAIAITHQVPLRPNPQIPVPVRHQAVNAFAVRQARHVPEKPKIQPIESDQAGLRTDPEIAIAGLGDRINRPAREPLLGAPLVVDILRHRAVGRVPL